MCPGTTFKDKEPSKLPLISFCVGHLLLGMGPAAKNGFYPLWDSLGKKTNFSFTSSYQLAIASE